MKKHLLLVIAGLAVFLLNGCGPPLAGDIHYLYDLQKYPGIVRKNTEQNYDQFKKHTWISGPNLGVTNQYMYLRALADDAKKVQFIQLYVRHFMWGQEGYNFHSAYDQDGRKLQFAKIDYDEDWGPHYDSWGYGTYTMEQYALDDAAASLGYKFLADHRKSGLSVKFYGQNGNRVYEIPAVYIDDYLAVLEEGGYNLKGLK